MTAAARIMKTDQQYSYIRFHDVNAIEYVELTNQTCIYHKGGEKSYFNVLPQEILETWCINHGSSMEGRITSARILAGIRNKAPILISERSLTMFFPMRSIYGTNAANRNNIWINESEVLFHAGEGRSSVTIIFRDGYRLQINYDARSFAHQVQNCRLFREKLLQAEAKDAVLPADHTHASVVN